MRAARNLTLFFIVPILGAFLVDYFRSGSCKDPNSMSLVMTIIGFPILFMIVIYVLTVAFSKKDK